MSSTAPSRLQVLSLYRGILRNANKFPNYNFKAHAKRRTVAAFHECKSLVDSQQIQEKYRFGQDQLELIRRQALLSSLYPEDPSVVTQVKRQ
eukprot:gene42989-52540_t